MSAPIITFFNNKGGVGKTSTAYHVAWMYALKGLSVVAVDLDPQANLTSMFLDEDSLEALWSDMESANTIYGPIKPMAEGTGSLGVSHVESVDDRLALIPGDLVLSRFEEELSTAWLQRDSNPRSLRILGSFWQVIDRAATTKGADIVIVDVGPNLGAINRAALLASDHVVVPLAPDLFSLQGLRNFGPRLREWRRQWQNVIASSDGIELPQGLMEPIGYVVMQHAVRLGRPVKAYDRWAARIPAEYRSAVLSEEGSVPLAPEQDDHCLALLKHYRSLVPMAMEARKPLFSLRPADGAIGAHFNAVQAAREDFDRLADAIWHRLGKAALSPPSL